MKRLSELKEGVSPGASSLLVNNRYVDDFMKSLRDIIEAKKLAQETDAALKKLGMETKGWAFTGELPQEGLSGGNREARQPPTHSAAHERPPALLIRKESGEVRTYLFWVRIKSIFDS